MRWTSIVTNAGTVLLAGTTEKKLILTRAAVSGASSSIETLAEQLSLADYKFDIPITQQIIENSLIKLRIQFINDNVLTAFNLYQIGIYAKLEGDVNDQLFMIIQATTPDYIPTTVEEPGLMNEYIVNTHISSTENVNVTISLASYITVDQLDTELVKKISTANIANNLLSDNENLVLGAPQGKILMGKITDLNNDLIIKPISITAQSVVTEQLHIRAYVWGKIATISGFINNTGTMMIPIYFINDIAYRPSDECYGTGVIVGGGGRCSGAAMVSVMPTGDLRIAAENTEQAYMAFSITYPLA